MGMNETKRELTLILLYLNPWTEVVTKTARYRRSWKSYGFEDMNKLSDDGSISDSKHSKSVAITDKGIEKALELMKKYGIDAQRNDRDL
jgi:hypothetical protein